MLLTHTNYKSVRIRNTYWFIKGKFLNYSKWSGCASILVGARSKSGVAETLFIFKTANTISFDILHFQTLLCLLYWPVEKASIFYQKWKKSLDWKMKLVRLTRNNSVLLHQCRCLPLSTEHLTRIEALCLVILFVPIHCI